MWCLLVAHQAVVLQSRVRIYHLPCLRHFCLYSGAATSGDILSKAGHWGAHRGQRGHSASPKNWKKSKKGYLLHYLCLVRATFTKIAYSLYFWSFRPPLGKMWNRDQSFFTATGGSMQRHRRKLGILKILVFSYEEISICFMDFQFVCEESCPAKIPASWLRGQHFCLQL